jgi:esterase/lipase superfamily enzyme/tetratricopeptide (TPR) repeat protein
MSFDVCRFGKVLRSASALMALALIAQTLLLFSGMPVRAQSPDDFAAFSREIPALANKGEPEQAIALAQRYLSLAGEADGEDSLEYATAATWLGWLYKNQQRYAEAEPLLEQALAIREAAYGENHPLVSTSLNNLAGLYQAQGRDGDVAALDARIAAIRAKAVGLNMLEVLPREIQELQAKGKDVEAARLAERYVALARERYGANQPGVVPALLEAAFVFEQQAKLLKAEKLLKQALEIRVAAFGPRSPEVADSAELLGVLYQKAGRFKLAERSLKRALSIRKAVYGRRNEKTIETMEMLAGVYDAAGRKEEAEELYANARKLGRQMQRRFAFARDEPTYAVVKVFYATDRKNTGAKDPAETYGGDRGPLTFGVASVSIPRDHRMGALETPSIWRLEWCNDPDRFVVLLSVDETDKAKFFADVSERVKKSAGKSAFVFVHGYNVAFVDAARRTAQMTYDLGFDGAPVLYSWPSQASYASYKVDETNAEWSRLDFKSFLKDFAEQSDADNIYLIAHSMGTRVLTGALKELVLEDPSIRDKFDEIILAAPDIDADTFKRDIAPKILAGEGGTTLYASSGDYALMASKTFAGYQRAGDTAEGVTIAPGVDTIDASAIRTDFVGHSYYADSDSVLGDLRDLILGKPPEKRSRLSPVKGDSGSYWTFSAGQALPK